MTIWYILCSIGTIFLVLVSYTMKNLATLMCTFLNPLLKSILSLRLNPMIRIMCMY
jgi:hypothetical protein